MHRLIVIAMLAGLAGCFTASEPKISHWPMTFAVDSVSLASAEKPSYGVARLMQIEVRSPFDNPSLAVARADGTLAFDPLNEFAASPGLLLRGVVYDSLAASGKFRAVVPGGSVAKAEFALEVSVVRLCLDCQEEGVRRAECELSIRLLRDREIVKTAQGTGEADALAGDYGQSFSKAVSAALASALSKLD